MNNENNLAQKIRLKFANGEEFEAEGNREFIESQRDYFLALVKKLPPARQQSGNPSAEDTVATGTLVPALYATSSSSKKGHAAPQNPVFPNTRLWEQLLTQEGEQLALRRKFHLSADEAALILLAGGRELLNKEGGSALWLSRALEKSNFAVPRLDRLLAPAVKLGLIQSQGAKRSRLYMLTPAGLARAFVLAEKKALE
ncbi:MAG: hypothetical protein MJ053_00565 [Elusimicrobiaceae bacterium]|nr:hypothetical protein [Elusimicrobiaceae bacterium]